MSLSRFSSSPRPHALCWLLVAVLGFLACTPKLYIRETYRSQEMPKILEGYIALSRGETIQIKEILSQEQSKPLKVVVTRLMGTYILTADGFRNIWMIKPTGAKQASYRAIPTPGNVPLRQPKFVYNDKNNCVTLIWGSKGQNRRQLHRSGDLARSCNDLLSADE